MTSYLISNLTSGQVDSLQNAGVSFYLCDQESRSYIFEGDRLALFLRVLQVTATEAPSAFQNVTQLHLDYHTFSAQQLQPVDGTKVMVQTNGSSMPDRLFLTLFESILGPVVRGNIVLHLPSRAERARLKRAPFTDGDFHVHVYSSPEGKRRLTPPKRIWGLPVRCRERSFGPTGHGIPLVDQESEYVVGELFEGNLYIHHDLLNGNSQEEYDLLGGILAKAAVDICVTAEERAQRIKNGYGDARQKSRRLYIKACSFRIQELIARAEQELDKTDARLAALQDRVLQMVRSDSFGGATVAPEQRQVDFSSEFARLQKVSRVKSVSSGPNVVTVKTETLFAQGVNGDKNSYEIGEFLIVITLSGAEHPVRWFNGSRRVDGIRPSMNAPTVYADGSPITAEIQETMVELIGRLDLSVVVELAIQFIETVNDDLPGSHLAKWPLAH